MTLVSAFSCSKKPNELRKNEIVGRWTNLTLAVTMNRYEQEDSILRANEENWEQVLRMKPIVSIFNKDGTFAAEYSDLKGQLAKTVTGTWDVRNDSLIVWRKGKKERAYHFTINNNRVTFRANLDWDEDGLPDKYDAVLVKTPLD